ncbi:MAG TPA: hypothetical protein DIT05_00770 [Morganella sp. (in: Bacteria)]|nr:hypothetical protein [Morganella sp. (in: enterobacteria)]
MKKNRNNSYFSEKYALFSYGQTEVKKEYAVFFNITSTQKISTKYQQMITIQPLASLITL